MKKLTLLLSIATTIASINISLGMIPQDYSVSDFEPGGKKQFSNTKQPDSQDFPSTCKKTFLKIPGSAINRQGLNKLENLIINYVVESIQADGYSKFGITQINYLTIGRQNNECCIFLSVGADQTIFSSDIYNQMKDLILTYIRQYLPNIKITLSLSTN